MARVNKALKNVKYSVFFYILYILTQFFARKIFLDGLGDDFIGLTATLQSFLGFLNLAELGIGSAVGFSLYKPLFEKNQKEINSIISFFGYLYGKIGLILLISGIILSCFFPIIFNNISISLGIVYYLFFAFLISSLLGYFYNYHLFLLEADQKSYIVSSYFQSFNLLKIVIQSIVVFYLQSFILWITLELLFSLLYSFFLRKRIVKEYPWLLMGNNAGKIILKKYPELILKIKQISAHKLGVFVTTGTDQILIFLFISLESVAFFGNYQLIFGKLLALTNTAFAGTSAGIGNLVAENNKSAIKKVFWEMMALRFFIAGVLCITLWHLVEPFIVIWLGEKYILDENVLILFLSNLFILQIRVPVDHFKDAYGLFSDTWAPIAQSIMNLGLSLILVKSFGLAGILLGTFISFLVIIMIWRPYFLFKYGFETNLWGYWKEFLKLIFAFLLSCLLTDFIVKKLFLNYDAGFWSLFIFGIKVSFVILIVYSTFLFIMSKGFRDIYKRIGSLFKEETMKIDFISSSLTGGGAERVMVLLAEHFTLKGHTVSIITFNEGDAYEISLGIKRIRLHRGKFKNHKLRGLDNLFRHYKTKDNRPDIIISFIPETSLISILISKFYSIKIICSEHINYLQKGNYITKFTRGFLYRFSDKVTVLTAHDIPYYEKKGANVVVMPNPCTFEPLVDNSKSRKKIILAVGNLNRYHHKGFDNLITLISPVLKNNKDWVLKIIGGRDQTEKGKIGMAILKKLVSQNQMEKQIIFVGFRNDVNIMMQESAIFILPSRFEGLPMVLLEAMSQGMACIAYDCKTGPSDMITNNENGLLIEDQNMVAMSKGLELLISNQNLRMKLGERAIYSLDRYSIENVGVLWEKLFKTIGVL